MKILVLTCVLPYPLDSGGNTRVFNILKQLDLRGVEIVVGVVQDVPLDSADLDALHELLPKIKFIKLPYCKSLGSKLTYYFANLFGVDQRLCNRKTQKAIAEIITQESIDLVQTEFSNVARYLPVLRIPATLVYLEFRQRVREREAIAIRKWRSKAASFIKQQVMRREELSHLPRYQAAICMSEADADWLRARHSRTRIEVIDNGVDLEAFPYAKPLGPACGLYFLGWFVNHQNCIALDYFIESIWPLLNSSARDMVVVGKDLDTSRSAQLARLGIPYLGFLSIPELQRKVQHRILVVPLKSGSGTRLKILEAMAMGNPVISTAIGIEGIAAEDGRHYLHAETGDEFQRAIARLMTEPGLAVHIACQARQLVEHKYGWAALGAKQIDLFEDLIAASRCKDRGLR